MTSLLTDQETRDLLEIARQAAVAAAGHLQAGRAHLRQLAAIEEGGREVKLLADQVVNDILVARLQETGLGILSEESGRQDGRRRPDLFWVIDPLDGTVNFQRGIDYCGISIGLCGPEDRPLAGVIYDLHRDEVALGISGQLAELNGRPMHVSSVTDPRQGILTTGFTARMAFEPAALEEIIRHIMKFQKIRMMGCAVHSLLMLATGKVDAYYEKDIMLWDIAAGLAMIEAAGGVWTWEPGSRPYSKIIRAANPELIRHL